MSTAYRLFVAFGLLVAVQSLPAQRLGEERLASYGTFPTNTRYVKVLSCKSKGSNYVMVAITGKHGAAVDQIYVGCKEVLAGGTLSRDIVWTEAWDTIDDEGRTFSRTCTSGRVVSGLSVRTGTDGQLRGIRLRCRSLGANGLTTGTGTTLLDWVGGSGTERGPSSCTSERPATGLRVSTDVFRTGVLLGELFVASWIVAGVQLICEQPVVPR